MLDQLLATPGVEERCGLNSAFGFLALHGGLEAGTAEIAQAAAVAANASIYAVVQPSDLKWHIPSHRFDPLQSDALVAFLEHVEVVVSVHGFGGLRGDDDRWITGLLGGSNRALAAELAGALRTALPAYRWLDDLGRIPAHLRGVHPDNPVNRARNGGVQIELPPRVRKPGRDCATLIRALTSIATGWF
jgi:phage replication-related protein YjqB (UPF0714/DUF867 family)